MSDLAADTRRIRELCVKAGCSPDEQLFDGRPDSGIQFEPWSALEERIESLLTSIKHYQSEAEQAKRNADFCRQAAATFGKRADKAEAKLQAIRDALAPDPKPEDPT